MRQFELFSRRTDPRSSREAAKRAAPRAASDAGRILGELTRQGCAMTADEIAAALDLEAYVVRKRLPDPLERRGLVVAINRDTMARGDVLRWMVR